MLTDTETRLRGTRRGHIAQEFFTNSVHYPLANIFIELLFHGPLFYIIRADFYVIGIAAFVQACFLGTWQFARRPRPLLGNLIGPALYTVVEVIIEGPEFFAEPNHIAYWGFAFAIGAVQELRLRLSGGLNKTLTLLENYIRTNILLAGYWIFESLTHPGQYASITGFFSDSSHIFFGLAITFLGLVAGLASITSRSYLFMLRRIAAQLKLYSEWLLGPSLLSTAVLDHGALKLKRRKRSMLFMDIRNFTSWSEKQTPEKVVDMLNACFERAEKVWSKTEIIKVKFTGDEIMLVFATADAAARCAVGINSAMRELLKPYGLSAGTGVHCGQLVEGLIGSEEVKAYDIIGDAVNTAKRICDAAAGGEVLISESVYAEIADKATVSETKKLSVKGKAEPLIVYALEDVRQ
jgi:class 3 adenylate cyclase